MGFTTSALIATWIVLALFGLALAGIVRQIHFLTAGNVVRRSRIGPPIGRVAPSLGGEAFPTNRKSLLLFADADCATCEEVLDEYASLAQEFSEFGPAFGAVFAGSSGGFRATGVRIFSDSDETFRDFQIGITPFAVLLEGGGVVERAEPIGSPKMLRQLVTSDGG